jgi:hypothetical protein
VNTSRFGDDAHNRWIDHFENGLLGSERGPGGATTRKSVGRSPRMLVEWKSSKGGWTEYGCGGIDHVRSTPAF